MAKPALASCRFRVSDQVSAWASVCTGRTEADDFVRTEGDDQTSVSAAHHDGSQLCDCNGLRTPHIHGDDGLLRSYG